MIELLLIAALLFLSAAVLALHNYRMDNMWLDLKAHLFEKQCERLK